MAEAFARAQLERKVLVSSEGTDVEQELVECGAGIDATAVGDGLSQQRSYPSAFGGLERAGGLGVRARPRARGRGAARRRAGGGAAPGARVSRRRDGRRHRRGAGRAAAARVRRPSHRARPRARLRGCVRGHELPPPRRLRLAALRLGAHERDVRPDDARSASARSAYDDEGVAGASRSRSSARALLVGWMGSREVGFPGSMRADGWSRMPLVRMTNLHLEPGDATLEELIAGVERGHLPRDEQELVDRRQAPQLPVRDAGRVGDRRTASSGACCATRRTRASRRSSGARWTRSATETRGACTGLTNCGKGQPGQTAHVSHGTSPARFRGVQIGVRA